jgi:hypothetical protein
MVSGWTQTAEFKVRVETSGDGNRIRTEQFVAETVNGFSLPNELIYITKAGLKVESRLSERIFVDTGNDLDSAKVWFALVRKMDTGGKDFLTKIFLESAKINIDPEKEYIFFNNIGDGPYKPEDDQYYEEYNDLAPKYNKVGKYVNGNVESIKPQCNLFSGNDKRDYLREPAYTDGSWKSTIDADALSLKVRLVGRKL